MKTNKTGKLLSIVLITVMIFSMLPFSAAAQTPDSLFYVALGDSVPYGYGLSNPATESYVALFAKMMESDGYKINTVNMARNGITASSLLVGLNALTNEELVALKNADIITLNIGGNDLLGLIMTFLMEKGIDLTNFKAADLLTIMQFSLSDSQKLQIKSALEEFAVKFQQITAWLKINAPKARLIVSTIYNPIPPVGLGISGEADTIITSMNDVIWAGQEKAGYEVADTYTAFANAEAMGISVSNVNLKSAPYSVDIHPNAAGHKIMAEIHYGLKNNLDVPNETNRNITRAEVTSFLYELLVAQGKATTSAVSSFTDVKADALYYQAVSCLYSYKIISGYPDGSFKPDNPITRAEFAVLLCRFLNLDLSLAAMMPSTFNDVPTGHWAAGYINAVSAANIIAVSTDGNYRPNDYVTYVDAVAIVSRILSK